MSAQKHSPLPEDSRYEPTVLILIRLGLRARQLL